MKKQLTLIFALFITTLCWSQNGINYKAIIKDATGNAISNGNVTIHFSVLKTSSTGTVAYKESHTTTTDANGLVIRTIGNGTPLTNTFNAIKWESDAHFLKVEVDTGSGLVDMGVTEFNAVPYALNVSGLEAIDEGNGVGWRLKGSNSNFYGNIGENGLDLSRNSITSSTKGATGLYSTAIGDGTTASGISSMATGTNTIASGDFSTAFGRTTTASGKNSTTLGFLNIASEMSATAMGSNTTASGQYSTAMGYNTEALGKYSTAIGNNTIAPSYGETAIGKYNTLYTASNSINSPFDRLFVIGNGTGLISTPSFRNDALIVFKSGKITAPSLSIAEIVNDKSLITKEYFEAKSTMGLEQLDEGDGVGWRLAGRNPNFYGNIGFNAVDLSLTLTSSDVRGATGSYSMASGSSTIASGSSSTAMGRATEAAGSSSTALGRDTKALGNVSTAIGFETRASGIVSTAIGLQSIASGGVSTAMGANTVALSGYETVIGRYNTLYTPNSTTDFSSIDRLFVIGNGTSTNNRSNALTLLKNGDIGIGIDEPNVRLHVAYTSGEDANADNGNGSIVIGAIDGENIAIDNNELMARNNNAPATLNLQKDGGSVKVGGSIVHTSDRRLKRDISQLPYGLKEILQLQPKEYYWKNREQDHKSLGLIAQEVQPIIANVVTTENDEAKTLGVSYTELIPVLIKAIQEQQELIKALQLKVGNQETYIKDRDSKIEGLTAEFNQRLMQIETLLKVTQQ